MTGFRRTATALLVLAVLVAGGIVAANHFGIARPVSQSLEEDHRNQGIGIRAHYAYYILPNTLVLDLRRAEDVSPADLGRALFQSAEALHERGATYEKVILSRSGAPVFVLDGADFAEIGEQFSYGENPIYMIRKLPPKLCYPDGTQAYGEWGGGLLRVVGKEMEDFADAMATWAAGTDL